MENKKLKEMYLINGEYKDFGEVFSITKDRLEKDLLKMKKLTTKQEESIVKVFRLKVSIVENVIEDYQIANTVDFIEAMRRILETGEAMKTEENRKDIDNTIVTVEMLSREFLKVINYKY